MVRDTGQRWWIEPGVTPGDDLVEGGSDLEIVEGQHAHAGIRSGLAQGKRGDGEGARRVCGVGPISGDGLGSGIDPQGALGRAGVVAHDQDILRSQIQVSRNVDWRAGPVGDAHAELPAGGAIGRGEYPTARTGGRGIFEVGEVSACSLRQRGETDQEARVEGRAPVRSASELSIDVFTFTLAEVDFARADLDLVERSAVVCPKPAGDGDEPAIWIVERVVENDGGQGLTNEHYAGRQDEQVSFHRFDGFQFWVVGSGSGSGGTSDGPMSSLT